MSDFPKAKQIVTLATGIWYCFTAVRYSGKQVRMRIKITKDRHDFRYYRISLDRFICFN